MDQETITTVAEQQVKRNHNIYRDSCTLMLFHVFVFWVSPDITPIALRLFSLYCSHVGKLMKLKVQRDLVASEPVVPSDLSLPVGGFFLHVAHRC